MSLLSHSEPGLNGHPMNSGPVCPRPSTSQLAWSECELGVIIHLDVQVFEAEYEFRRRRGYTPPASVFNPAQLDTDQWLDAAVRAGARYAILAAKHCSGFSLWPTSAHDYSVASSPWRNGQGDIVADFMASCRRYGVLPGLYCSASTNARFNVDNPGRVLSGDAQEQGHYNEIVLRQLTELWTNYGELFEIWFDGGVLHPEAGGPDITPLIQRLQPNAVIYCGPPDTPHLLRCSGNEHGYAALPNWSTTDETLREGLPQGTLWAPAECDIPSRKASGAFQGGWFWREGDERFLYSSGELLEAYFNSVGQGSNLLLGMVVDNRGLVPEADVRVYQELGEKLQRCFSHPVARVEGTRLVHTLDLPRGAAPNVLEIREDISGGECVRSFTVEALYGEKWVKIWAGSCIGHRRLERFEPLHASQIRLRVVDCSREPGRLTITAYDAEAGVFEQPLNLAERSRITMGRDSAGLVSLHCSNTMLDIHFCIDDGVWDIYHAPFSVQDGATVKAYASINELSRSRVYTATFGCLRKTWRIAGVSLDSPYKNEGCAGAEKLLDDDPYTYWHTYAAERLESAPPHEVILDAGRRLRITAFTLLPRESDTHEGIPDEYEFYVSDDGQQWTLAAGGRITALDTNRDMRLIPLPEPLNGRYIRFVAKHVVDNGYYVVIAGIGAVEIKASETTNTHKS